MRPLKFLSLLVLAFVTTLPALALPAPMSEQELTDKSDLVALVRVLAVTCTSITTDEATGEELPGYLAQLKVVEVKKGDAKPGEVVLVTWRAIPKNVDGPWTVYYYPGEMVWTHLVGKDGSYTTTWWNGRGTVVSKAVIDTLPTTPGETVEIPKRDAAQ